MAYPQVRATGTGINTSDSTSHVITFPDGIQVGDLIVVIFGVDGNPTISIDTGYSGLGWTIETPTVTNGTALSTTMRAKIATGTTNYLSFTTSSSEQSAYAVYIISGTNNNPIEYSIIRVSGATGTSTNFDPPNTTGYNGTQDYLWLAVAFSDGVTVATAAPTNFTSLATQAGTSTGVSVSMATRQYTGISLNPDVFTSAYSTWIAYTINIEPYSGVACIFPYRVVNC